MADTAVPKNPSASSSSLSSRVKPASVRQSSTASYHNYSKLTPAEGSHGEHNDEHHDEHHATTPEGIMIEMDQIQKPAAKTATDVSRTKGAVASPSMATLPAKSLAVMTPEQLMALRNPGERKPFHQKIFKTPKETAFAMVTAAKYKADLTWDKCIIFSFLSGVFVAFGATLAIFVSRGFDSAVFALPDGIQRLLFGSCFHVALTFIVLFGGELFTGNTMTMTVGWLAGSINWKDYTRSMVIAYFFNFAGCAFGAAFLVYYAELFDHDPYLSAVKLIAEKKVSYEPHVVFLRAISANWLVCLAVFIATAAESVEGKMLACYIPVMTFAASSYEHCIANMYFIPLGLMYGANTTFGIFIYRNLLLATVGNFVGGALFMGVALWYLYVRDGAGSPKGIKEEKKD